MDRGTRNLLIGLLAIIAIVIVGSATFVVGLNMGRAEGTATLRTGVVERPSDAPEATSSDSAASDEVVPAGDSPFTFSPHSSTDQSVQDDFKVFWEVYDLMQSDFYGEIPNDEDLTYGAIRGMLQRLDDDYTSFIEPNFAEISREDSSGRFQGIGALVRLNDDEKLEIIRTFEDSPAEQAGILAGDVVVAVDGESIVGFGIYEAIALIRGPADTQVTLTIERRDVEESFEVLITRAEIEIPLVETRMIGSDIAYASLSGFEGTSSEQLRRELELLLARNPKGLILDLRGNPGGFLDESIDVSDLFLPEGVVVIERHRDGRVDTFRSDDGDLAENIPMVVLVDVGSASASEIVAGAIQDRDRGILIGTTTFGKGSVQRVHTLSDGGEFRVTTARWYTPDDHSISGQGLEPDIVVEQNVDTEADEQLDRAVEYLRSGQ